MAWIPKTQLSVATDRTTAPLITGDTETRAAVDGRIGPVAAGIISSDPTVKAAAAAASKTAVDTELASSPRIPALGDPDSFRVRDQNGAIAAAVTPGGDVALGDVLHRPSPSVWRLMDSAGAVAIEVTADGKTHIYDQDGGTGGTSSRRVILLLQLGQSNGEGRGRPYGPELDPADSRIMMWSHPNQSIVTATVPLSSPQQQVGISVATIMARRIIATEPAGTTVVVVNAAVGGSSLLTDITAGVWKVGYTGSSPKLFEQAMTTFEAARSATTALYGVTPEVRVAWHQGEADSGSTQSAYAAALDELIGAVRSRAGSDVTFTVGGMVPEYVAATDGSPAIRAAHIDTPKRVVRTGYADGIPNAGGSATTADLVHYAREGVERLGAAMYDASRRAVANTTNSVAYVPQRVSAIRQGSKVAVTWSAPFGRVTSYTVQYRVDGGTWTGIPTNGIDTTVTATGVPAGAAEVRLSTTNETGTSAYSTPVPAVGA